MSNILTIPGFSRVEIRTRGKDDILSAAVELRRLADELEFVAGDRDAETAVILAHHKIKATSKKLRGN